MSDNSGFGINIDPSIPTKCAECSSADIKYKGLGSYECSKCGHIMYDDYGKVREYLEDHRGATVLEVSDATGISKGKIRKLLEEERIEIAPNSAVFIFCEKCGKPIRTGKYCDSCANERAVSFANAQKEEAAKPRIQGFGVSRTDGKGAKRFNRP